MFGLRTPSSYVFCVWNCWTSKTGCEWLNECWTTGKCWYFNFSRDKASILTRMGFSQKPLARFRKEVTSLLALEKSAIRLFSCARLGLRHHPVYPHIPPDSPLNTSIWPIWVDYNPRGHLWRLSEESNITIVTSQKSLAGQMNLGAKIETLLVTLMHYKTWSKMLFSHANQTFHTRCWYREHEHS